MATSTKTSKPAAKAAAAKPAASRPAKAAKSAVPKLKSRGVVRDVEAGSSVDCVHCGERVKFQAKVRHKQVICNVYVDGRWDRVDHFHLDCYLAAGEPYGEADASQEFRRAARTAPANPAPTAAAS